MEQPALKVVVTEDEPMLRELMEKELRTRGYEVYVASDGAQGWQLIKEVNPDIVLLDLLMPVMSGYDVLSCMRQSEEHKHTPCIVLSNSGQADDLQRAYSVGANDVLIKAEFNPSQLVVKVDELLAKEKAPAGEQ